MGKPQQLELSVLTIPFQQCDCVNNSRDQWRGQENPQPAKGADAGVADQFEAFIHVPIVCAEGVPRPL